MKKTVLLLNALLFIFLLRMPFSVSAAPVKTPVVLQINDYYVLYTFPKAPYVDQNNRLMIPLRAISELLGSNVKYEAKHKRATIEKDGKKLVVYVGSKEIEINGTIQMMDTVPTIHESAMFVPLRALIDSFELPVKWDKSTGVVHVESDAMKNNERIVHFEDSDVPPKIADNNAILPISYRLEMSKPGKGKLTSGTITVEARNISGKAILEGKEDLHLVYFFDHTMATEMDTSTTDVEASRERPARAADERFMLEDAFASGQYNENLQYILALGRTFE
ncbi:copper amine oxidase [Paenibacillus sp. 32O-W]|uniref:stalk domain-containing protein n=1 Tax=Paenibacillus sp. 32O-W TaxID=1695218 RepID=UPI000721EF86|nr:stalk domain-containing protein [Paenibacillus sp. 32O-W]ALS29885.1 copper amine oxidase [Paenibacillus sp. 32O-W]